MIFKDFINQEDKTMNKSEKGFIGYLYIDIPWLTERLRI